MGLFRVLAVVLFVGAGLAGEGWFVRATTGTTLALIGFGLASLALSTLAIPQPPAR